MVLLVALAMAAGCKKQVVNEYTLNPVYVNGQSGTKGNLKADLQLITIMHADIFGSAIGTNELNGLTQAYMSLGDKDIVIDRITQHFLTDSDADIPTDLFMRTNLDQFITEAYNRFYVRQPSEAELYFLKKVIQENNSLTAKDVYYAMLTAEEYKYY
jgi:hypothetical protein